MYETQKYPSECELDTEGNVISAEDWLGNRFRVGDLVMYCISAGRGQMMAIGKVQALRVNEYSKTKNVINPDEPITGTWTSTGTWNSSRLRVPVPQPVPQHKWVVEVKVLTERTSGHSGNERRTRPAWVNEMNITAVLDLKGTLL